MASHRPGMGCFERYLTVWVGLGILAGVGLGQVAPALFETVARIEFAHVNLVVAVFLWVMIYPMMIQIDFAAVKDVGKRPGVARWARRRPPAMARGDARSGGPGKVRHP